MFLFAVLQLLRIDYVTLDAYQQQKERDAIITAFIKHDDRAQVLITIYAVDSTRLNL